MKKTIFITVLTFMLAAVCIFLMKVLHKGDYTTAAFFR